MNAEQQLAFHGPIRFHSWAESSKSEFKFKVELLDGRDGLAHFERATRRRGKRAGQRYQAFWQNAEGEPVLGAPPTELWFAGANWSHQGGATVAFTPAAEGESWVRQQVTTDVDEEQARKYYLGLVQVDDDERPVNQAQAALVEWAETLVGGPKSKAAAMRCQDQEFQLFVGLRLKLKGPATAEQCDSYIKRACGIHTKRLLDYANPTTHEPYWDLYERRVQRPFILWTQSRAPRESAAAE